jgi:mannonate dehydratase
MKIVDAKVIVCSPGRNFVTLKLITEDGVYGLGDATLNGRELAAASYLTEHVVPLSVAMPDALKTSGNTFIKARTGAAVR